MNRQLYQPEYYMPYLPEQYPYAYQYTYYPQQYPSPAPLYYPYWGVYGYRQSNFKYSMGKVGIPRRIKRIHRFSSPSHYSSKLRRRDYYIRKSQQEGSDSVQGEDEEDEEEDEDGDQNGERHYYRTIHSYDEADSDSSGLEQDSEQDSDEEADQDEEMEAREIEEQAKRLVLPHIANQNSNTSESNHLRLPIQTRTTNSVTPNSRNMNNNNNNNNNKAIESDDTYGSDTPSSASTFTVNDRIKEEPELTAFPSSATNPPPSEDSEINKLSLKDADVLWSKIMGMLDTWFTERVEDLKKYAEDQAVRRS